MTPLESELGWAAGILDGEGTIGIYRQLSHGSGRGRSRSTLYESFHIRVIVGNTNLDILHRFAEIVPGGVIYRHVVGQTKRNPRQKPAYVWHASGLAAKSCCELLKPYLVGKRGQCEMLLQAAHLLSFRARDGEKRFVANPNKEALSRLRQTMLALNRRGVLIETDSVKAVDTASP